MYPNICDSGVHYSSVALLGIFSFYCLVAKFFESNPLADGGRKGKKQSRCKVSLTASLGSTVAEEIIVLLCRLHTLPAWNQTINDYITQQLSTITDILLEGAITEVIMDMNMLICLYEYLCMEVFIHEI